jgi:uncharacterized protein YjbI with pentapeptide repeats
MRTLSYLILVFSISSAQAQTIPRECITNKTEVVKSCSNQMFRGLLGINANNEIIENVFFKEGVIQSSTFRRVHFKNIEFSGAQFRDVKFIGCRFENVNFAGSRWVGVTVTNSTFENVSFAASYFDRSSLSSATKIPNNDVVFRGCYSISSTFKSEGAARPICRMSLF